MRAAVNCRETDRGGDVRVEIVVGNACGGKPGSHGSKAILLTEREKSTIKITIPSKDLIQN